MSLSKRAWEKTMTEDQPDESPLIDAVNLDDSQDCAWFEAFPDSILVAWYCPKCDVRNVDSPTNTAFPMCGNCGEEFDWDDFDLDWDEGS